LPREVRARRLLDDSAEIGIGDLRDRGLQLGAQRDGRRDDARGATLGRALRRIERSDPEAQLIDGVTAQAEARDELRSKHLQLVGPDAGGHLHEQDAALERDGMRTVGDPGADGELPLAHRDGRAAPGKAILARAIEQIDHRLGSVEVLAATPLRGPGHRPMMLASRAAQAWKAHGCDRRPTAARHPAGNGDRREISGRA
jgi:hypothetical protein